MSNFGRGPTDIKVLLVTSPAWPPIGVGGKVGPLWQIRQAPEEIQGGGSLNVNTLRGRVCEVVETLSQRKVDV